MTLFLKNKNKTVKYILPVLFILFLTVIIGCSHKSENIPTAAQSVQSLVAEGWQAFEQGDYEKAITSFETTIKRNVDPDLSIDAYRGLGWTYSRIEKYSQAVTNFSFVISLETVKSKKRPVLPLEGVPAVAVPDTANPAFNGNLQVYSEQNIVSIESIESYSARVSQKLGASPAYIIAGGTNLINLPKTEISNAAGTALGTSLDLSISFSPDSLLIPVENISDIDLINEYYVDTQKGVVSIMPRINKLANITASFKYHEKGYIIKLVENHLIVLEKDLENLSKAPVDQDGDIYYLKGEFYNKYNSQDITSGGTFFQADAYAGMAAAFLAQGDYKSAASSARTLFYINQDLKQTDPAKYPYKRSLFTNDTAYDLWNFYKLAAIAAFNLKDYPGAERYLEYYLGQGQNAVDNTSQDYIYSLINKINSLPATAPENWTPIDIW